MAKVIKLKLKIPAKAAGPDLNARVKKAIAITLEASLQVGLENLRGELAKTAPTGVTGALANNTIVEVKSQQDKLEGKLFMMPYAELVNDGFGGKGVMPPAAPLEQWVTRKGLVSGLNTAPWMKALVPPNIRSESDEKFTKREKTWLAGFFVRRKIAREGVEPTKFIDKALKRKVKDIEKVMSNSLKDLARRIG